MDKVIVFNQEAWVKTYNDMNTELRKETKNDFGKDLFHLMNNASIWKSFRRCKKT